MKKLYFILPLLILISGIRSNVNAKIKVACVGNSITENYDLPEKDKYPTILQRYLGSESYEVRNFGAGGHTLLKKGDTPYWNSQKHRQALEWQPDIVIIKLGTNDAKPHNWIYKNEFESNYIEFVNSFKNLASKPRFFLCYPIPAYPNNWLPVEDKILTDEMIPMIYNVAVITEATAIIDLHTPFLGKNNFVYDKIHPNAKGTTYMAHIIGKAICPECNIPDLPTDLFIRISAFDYTDKTENLTSSVGSMDDIQNLINNNPMDGIKTIFTENMWFAAKLPVNVKITGYSLTMANSDLNNMPKSWALQGSLLGRAWINLDVQNKIEFKPLETQVFEIPFSQITDLSAYKYFRILINENNGGEFMELNEWQLFGFENISENDITINGGTITGQYDGFPDEKVENLIDKRIDTKYCVVDKGTGWIQYDSPVKAKVNKYKLTSCVDLFERNLKSWQLLGSENNVQWDILDERIDQDFITKFHCMEFPVITDKAYDHFRLNITGINAGRTFQFAEWQLFENTLSAINENDKIKCTVFSKNGKVYIKTDERVNYEMFNLFGNITNAGTADSGITTIGSLSFGILFIKVHSSLGSKVVKLITRATLT
jgi:lysophospholipase L1-like esterase